MPSGYPDTRSVLQLFASRVLEVGGEMPQHVAMIMDGNRRYARSHGMQTKSGHEAGVVKSKEVTRWMYEMKIPELTLYAFSIENFKRSENEVEVLMNMVHERSVELLKGLEEYKKRDVCVQFIGNWNLVPSAMKPNLAKIMVETRHCKTYKLNIAFAYTGRNGIERSMISIEKGLRDGQILPEDVSEYLIDEAQNLVSMRPVDILLRTGGDSRISDFMIWESSHAYIHFLDAAWPDMTFWQFWDSILNYQMYRYKHQAKLPPSKDALTFEQKKRVESFLTNLREKKWDRLEKLAKKSDCPTGSAQDYKETFFRSAMKQLLSF